MIFLSIRIDIPLMLGYFEHVYKLPMKFFATRKTGEITTRYSDASTIKSVLTNIAMTIVMDVVMAVGVGIVLFRMNSSLFSLTPVSYTHLRAHETDSYLVCRLLLEKKKKKANGYPRWSDYNKNRVE